MPAGKSPEFQAPPPSATEAKPIAPSELPRQLHDVSAHPELPGNSIEQALKKSSGSEDTSVETKTPTLRERLHEISKLPEEEQAAALPRVAGGSDGDVVDFLLNQDETPAEERRRDRESEPTENVHEVMRRLDRTYEEFFETGELTPELKARMDHQFAEFHRLVAMRWSDARLPGLDNQLANLGRTVGITDFTTDELGNPIGEHNILARMDLISKRIDLLSRPTVSIVTQRLNTIRADVLDAKDDESEADKIKKEDVLARIPGIEGDMRRIWQDEDGHPFTDGRPLSIDQEMRILGNALAEVDPADTRLAQIGELVTEYSAAQVREPLLRGISPDLLRPRNDIQREIHETMRFFLHDPEHPDTPSSDPNPLNPNDQEAGLKTTIWNEYVARRAALTPAQLRKFSSVEEFALLGQIVAANAPNHPRMGEINRLLHIYNQHPETILEKIRSDIDEVVGDIRADLTGEAEQMEDLDLPETAFETLRNEWDHFHNQLRDLQRAFPESDEEERGNIEAQNQIKEQLHPIEEELTIYLKVAERVGLLRPRNSEIPTEFDNLLRELTGTERENKVTASQIAERLKAEVEGDYKTFQDREELDLRLDRQMPQVFKYERGNGTVVRVSETELHGIIAFYSRESKRSMQERFTQIVNPQDRWRSVEGAWSWRTEAEAQEEARKSELWKPIWSTSYDLSNCQSMEDVIYASDDHINFIRITEKTPEAALAKIQAFSDAIGAYAKSVPKERGGTEKISSEDINMLKVIYQDQAYALLAETFNGEYNVPNLSAVYAKFSSMSEAMDHFEKITLLRDGLVYRANMIQKRPGYELLYRWAGLNGQLKGYMNSQIAMYGLKMEQLAEDLIGELVMDRHVTREGIPFEGKEAIMLNMKRLGHDIPDEEMEALYVRDTASLLAAQQRGEKLTEQEQLALMLRIIKSKPASQRTTEEKKLLKKAKDQAKAAVNTYLQLNNMFGETALRACPSYMGDAKKADADGSKAINSLEAKEAHEVPIWMSERFTMLGMNMLDWRISDHNEAIAVKIREARDKQGGPGKDEITDLMKGFIYRSSDLYQALILNAQDAAGQAIFDHGWNAKLLDYDLEDATKNFQTKSFKFKAKKENGRDVLLVDTQTKKTATIISASKNVMGRSLTSTYDANQVDQQNESITEEVWLEALELRAGTKRPDQVSKIAVRRLIYDPTLDRVPVYRTEFIEENGLKRLVRTHIAGPDIGLGEQKGAEAFILAACQGSFMRRWENRRALSIKFEKRTDFGFPNALRNGGLRRIFFPQALFATNPNRWTPRAEWMGARILTTATSLGDRNGLEDSFENIKLIKRRFVKDKEYNQEETDNPESNTAATEYMNQQRLHWAYVGTPGEGEVKAAFFEKPTAELEEIMGALPNPDFLILDTDPKTGEKFWKFDTKHINEQARFVKDIQDRLGRVKIIFDPLFKNISEATASTGAWDMRKMDFYTINSNGVVQMKSAKDILEPLKGPDGGGKEIRDSLNIGRSRLATKMVADDILTYLTRFELPSESDPSKPFAGALKEYSAQAQWLLYLKTFRIKTSVIQNISPDASQYLDLSGEYVTLWDFLISKWQRR